MEALTCSNCTAPLDAEESPPGVITCKYCGRAHRFAKPPPAPAVHRHPIGSKVVVQWGQQWWDATVLETPAPNVWKIHYDGWAERWNELVGPERIRDRSSVPRGAARGVKPWRIGCVIAVLLIVVAGAMSLAANRALHRPSQDPPAAEQRPPPVMQPGQMVEVYWNGTWYRARILEVRPNGHARIHYEGWADSYDEVVGPRRVRSVAP
jgi:hypothetical protein